MKQGIIIFVVVTSTWANTIFGADQQVKNTVPAPEIIQCESQNSCQMTPIAVLLEGDQKSQQNVNMPKKEKQTVTASK